MSKQRMTLWLDQDGDVRMVETHPMSRDKAERSMIQISALIADKQPLILGPEWEVRFLGRRHCCCCADHCQRKASL